MKSAFRNGYFTLSRSLNPNPNPPSSLFSLHLISHSSIPSIRPQPFCSVSPIGKFSGVSFTSMEGSEPYAPPPLEKQFEDFRAQLEESGTLRERIRAVVMEIESTTRLIHSSLLLVHQSRSTPGTAPFCMK